MFDTNVTIRGKHATYLKFLCEKTKLLRKKNSQNGAGVFKRYIDVFLVAPLFGVMKNIRSDEDKSNDDKVNIFAEQIIKEQRNLEFVYQIVLLNDNSKKLSPDEKIDLIFKKNGDIDLFMSYVRGGIEYLYEYFTDGATTQSDYFEKVISLIDDTQLDATENFDEFLKNLTNN